MIISMMLVYPVQDGAGLPEDAVSGVRRKILGYWRQEQCEDPLVLGAFAVEAVAYATLRKVGLSEKSTERIFGAIMAAVGRERLSNYVSQSEAVAGRLGA